MKVNICNNSEELGNNAAAEAAEHIKKAIDNNGLANIVLATGASQFSTLSNLVQTPDIDWSKVVMFHLDEYAGLPETHPASFRKYIKERFLDSVPSIKAVHFIEADKGNPTEECKRLNKIISKHQIDIALVGIGENGHLAFNDPPADFEIEDPYIIVELDEACRKQQLNEGWFATLDDVPNTAISMSIKQILKSSHIVCSVPDERKALAVKNCIEGPVTPEHPASILQKHNRCTIYLDKDSASLLTDK